MTRKEIQRRYYEKHYLGNYEARRDKTLRDRYGITLIQYKRMLKKQKGVCAVCYRPPKSRALDVDHCHKTGHVRGLLCVPCNRFIIGIIEKRGVNPARVTEYLHAD